MGVIVEIAPNQNSSLLTSSYTDVTEYVDLTSIGRLSESIDFNDFNIGVVRNSNISLKLNNRLGLFSEAGGANSIFSFKRGGSAVRISYRETFSSAKTGLAIAGSRTLARMSPRVTLFVGVISDEGFQIDPQDGYVELKVLSALSILDDAIVTNPLSFEAGSASSAISSLLSVSAFSKYTATPVVNLQLDPTLDNTESFEDSSVRDALTQLLEVTNSTVTVSYPDDATNEFSYEPPVVTVSDRRASFNLKKTFFNQHSPSGPENILGVTAVRDGKTRLFNQITYNDGEATIKNQSSINRDGLRTFEFSSDLLETTASKNDVIQSYLTEFGEKKQEIDFEVPLTYENLDLNLLDRVSLDYAPQLVGDQLQTARYGSAVYGTDIYAEVLDTFQVRKTVPYKIYDKKVNFRRGTIKISIREV